MKKIVCFLGSSATGKTFSSDYLKMYGIPELVSCTTRKPRKGEIDGVTYHYVDEEEFAAIDKVEVTHYSNNSYCLSVNEVEEKLRDNDFVTVILDRNGVQQIKSKYGDMVKVIYLYSTTKEMIERMKMRGDSNETIAMRIEHAVRTHEFENNYYADHIIRSKDLELLKRQLKLILKYEGYPWWRILWGDIKYYSKRWFNDYFNRSS